MIKIKEICRMKGRCILVSLCFLFIPDCFSQKLKPVVVKKLEGDVYSKEEYSIIKRGKDKGKSLYKEIKDNFPCMQLIWWIEDQIKPKYQFEYRTF